jgi:hypothetical protein
LRKNLLFLKNYKKYKKFYKIAKIEKIDEKWQKMAKSGKNTLLPMKFDRNRKKGRHASACFILLLNALFDQKKFDFFPIGVTFFLENSSKF